jgi:hypothetical protein
MGPSARTPTRSPASSAPTDDLPRASAPARDTRDTETTKIPTLARAKTSKQASQPIKPVAPKPTPTGGTYSMTSKPSERTATARAAEAKPVSFQVSADAAGHVRLELEGRVVTLTRREARTLADKLLRAVK